ncbi:MAG: glycoside hydrolase family 88 protein [Oxalobacter formigenes]|nr:glycoside hydrolase family 88 protein [Acetatifactor muris]MCM1219729.1 glycoside hydrolase family 88 protein [Lachnospiraceae bacterium]MCM1513347.1 glycoside hydrolase family 88 protein [Oxalobacter formigenes]MCM1543097.1 glycoside hydrolase family 88 protein [Blautia sp.]
MTNVWAEKTWEKLEQKLKAECERMGSGIPFLPVNGHYRDCMMPGGLHWWTNGFWPGLLWQAYHATEDEAYRIAAHGAGIRLAETLHEPEKLEHDTGFLFQLSSVADYQLTQDEDSCTAALQAAKLLADRLNDKGGFLRAWNSSPWMEDSSGLMIIDCMMNLSLLFWASEVSHDSHYADVAVRHAQTSLHHLLRPDGSCAHIASFDAETGSFLGTLGGQGYGEGSSWSRGQGWALYGFALAYRHTGLQEFLDASKRSANYCIACLQHNSWVPLRDFRAPDSPVKVDSGAGVIIACGLLELAGHLPELEKALYQNAALKLLQACEEKFADYSPDTDGILGGGATMYHDERLANAAIIYNDYFYVEAVLRLLGKNFMIW